MSAERDERAKVPGREPAKALPKRFYVQANVAPILDGSAFRVLLDGKAIHTPRRHEVRLPARALADAIAGEWQAQGERIDPSTMPLTRLANTVIDGVCGRTAQVGDDIVRYAASDLLCYRAKGPAELVSRQAALWDPILAWAHTALGARLRVSAGVTPLRQPDDALQRIGAEVASLEPFRLGAMHAMTTLTGSSVLALAVARRRITAEEGWAAAHVDEDWQIEQWGEDNEAVARRARRWEEMKAAERLWHLAGQG